MSPILFLSTQSEMEVAEKLKDVLQCELREFAVNIKNIKAVIAEDSSLEREVRHSRCIVLVYSHQCEKYLNEGEKERTGHYVTFDGPLIKSWLHQKNIIDKLLVVHFGYEPEKWILDRVPPQRVFQLNLKFKKSDDTVKLVVDAIKSIIRK